MADCPTHGKEHLIGYSINAMWHPATGEPYQYPDEWHTVCTAVVKVKRFLWWTLTKRCDFRTKEERW